MTICRSGTSTCREQETGARRLLVSRATGWTRCGRSFTGQERDAETTLDFFQARYYSAPQGRFTSPDPGNAGANLGDPQSWNVYAYVGNNPLTYTDPSGEGIFGWIGGIAGGLFGGPLGAWIGSMAGNGADAAIWGPEAGGTSFYNPTNNFGLGNASPWGSTPGLGGPGGGVYGGGSAGGVIFSFEDGQPAGWQIALGNAADFTAGVIDNFSLGLTGPFRRSLPGGDPRNPCSGYYTAGQWSETGAEIGLTLGSGALKSLAKGASRSAVRAAARSNMAKIGFEAADGEVVHHVLPLFGHPGGTSALFPTGGLPAWIHSGAWNLRSVNAAAHLEAHQTMRAAERVGTAVVNPALTGLRVARAAGGCRGN